MEAILAFFTAVLFIYIISLSRSSPPSSYTTLALYSHLNDMLEVSYRSGDFENLAKWAEGDEAAGEKAKVNFEKMAKESGFCLTLEIENKNRKMEINCPGKRAAVSTVRTLVLEDGFAELRATIT
ncbi:MAG: hypothetical protein NT157_02205 [Candidatus Micrarchaeota archaeon]|nr:hypothetical protein [Candidatus Micrarchaeota archaeon]